MSEEIFGNPASGTGSRLASASEVERSCRIINEISWRHTDVALVLLVTLAMRLAWMILVDNRQYIDIATYDEAARYLAAHGELRYLTDGQEPYYAWFPPGWPFFLSIWYFLLGQAYDWVKLVNLLLSVIVAYLTVRIGVRAVGRPAAITGGLIMALLPGHIVYVNLAQYEIFLSTLLTCSP